MRIEEFRNYISYKNEIIQCENLETLLTFLKESDLFKEIMINTIKKVKKNKKYSDLKNILLKDIEFPTYLEEFSFIKPEDFAFSRFINFMETSYGEILIKKENVTYSDIVSMQNTFKVVDNYITYKNMPNFTIQQHKESERLKQYFLKELPSFKSFIEQL